MWSRKKQAADFVNLAYRAWKNEEWATAAVAFEQALAIQPDHPKSPVLWYDAALAYKFLRNWPKAFELGKQAAALAEPGSNDPAFWNLGIAATIMREWEVARGAWQGYGIPIEPGEGPIEQGFGMACVRIDTGSGNEVVWAERLCPTRARVVSVPFDPSRRFGEVVVHDGEPKGRRVWDDIQVSVFDELVLFEPSSIETLSAQVQAASAEDMEALVDAFVDSGHGAEVLKGTLTCKACSEGSVILEPHEHETGSVTVMIAAPEDAAVRILDRWRANAPESRDWTDLAVAY
jgi:hypothetical protein